MPKDSIPIFDEKNDPSGKRKTEYQKMVRGYTTKEEPKAEDEAPEMPEAERKKNNDEALELQRRRARVVDEISRQNDEQRKAFGLD